MLLLPEGHTDKAWEPSNRYALSAVGKHRIESSLLSSGILYCTEQRVTTPDAAIIQFVLLEDGHVDARNMSRIVM
jgi:hypothetical protein